MIQSKVSVIIPVYNMELYIAETLDSVLQSDYNNFEVIVMDDGSTDDSYSVAQKYAESDSRVRLYRQPNGGASLARNNAIEKAEGVYILPVDGDDLISSNYISQAAEILDESPNVKVVSREAEFFGKKTGRWKFKPFSLNLLCRTNLIDACSMYRKSDWRAVGGYGKKIMGREDWDFWLSIFATGGDFVRLPIVGFYYRIRANSKRVRTRVLHKEVIDAFNIRHKPLFYKELCGKLHYQRTHSRFINKLLALFRPQCVYSETKDPILEKLVYLANENEKIKEYLNINNLAVKYIPFNEKRIHLPGTKIKRSKARATFDKFNDSHLGYYEDQVSCLKLKSFLVVHSAEKTG